MPKVKSPLLHRPLLASEKLRCHYMYLIIFKCVLEFLLFFLLPPQDIADPFFAYCKQHADRFDRKWKRKNYLALQSYCKVSLQEREKQLTPEAQVRLVYISDSRQGWQQLDRCNDWKHVQASMQSPQSYWVTEEGSVTFYRKFQTIERTWIKE